MEIMEILLVWERIEPGHLNMNIPPPAPACLILQRVSRRVYRLVLPPVPPNSRIVGVLWVPPSEFTFLAGVYMDDYVASRIAST
jgi:hypothetical protein